VEAAVIDLGLSREELRALMRCAAREEHTVPRSRVRNEEPTALNITSETVEGAKTKLISLSADDESIVVVDATAASFQDVSKTARGNGGSSKLYGEEDGHSISITEIWKRMEMIEARNRAQEREMAEMETKIKAQGERIESLEGVTQMNNSGKVRRDR